MSVNALTTLIQVFIEYIYHSTWSNSMYPTRYTVIVPLLIILIYGFQDQEFVSNFDEAI